MILPPAAATYDQSTEDQMRQALRRADQRNFKRGEDVRLAQDERFFQSFVSGLIAHSGGGQGSALQLTAQISAVATSAANGDSVKLWPTALGLSQTVINSGAHTIQVFGTSPDTINGIATATGVTVAAGKTACFFCAVLGNWGGGSLA